MKLNHSDATLVAMDSIMDPVTSGSDLEEGEIDEGDNSEVEIISEKLVKFPSVGQKMVALAVELPVRKRSDWEEGIIDIKSKRRKPSCDGGPIVPVRVQEPAIMERPKKPLRSGNYNGRSPKSYQPRSQNRNGNISRRYSDLKKNAKSNSRSPSQNWALTQSNKEVLLVSPGGHISKEGTNGEDKQLKKVADIKSLPSADSQPVKDDSEDEEMELRLAALQSVVVRTTKTDETLDEIPSTPLPDDKKVDDEEEEDEELLRAQLLIEVAKKQTKEMEMQARIETQNMTKSAKENSRQQPPAAAPLIKRKFNPPNLFPKPDRLVINLGDDSSDSSDEDERVEESISALIKSARQSVDQNILSVPNAVSALPLHEQEEYHRLKGEIERRASKPPVVSTSLTIATSNQKQHDSLSKVASSQTLKSTSQKSLEGNAFLLSSTASVVTQKPQDELPKTGSISTLKEAAQRSLLVPFKAVAHSIATVEPQKLQDRLQQTKAIVPATIVAVRKPQDPPPKAVCPSALVLRSQDTSEDGKHSQDSQSPDIRCEPVATPNSNEPKAGVNEESKEKEISLPAGSQKSKVPEIVITKSALQTKAAASSTSDSLSKLPAPASALNSSSEKTTAQSLRAKKVAALKHQLLQKKNATKDALKSQLELVDKNRALLERSSQEVARLKAMLQTAEEAERQFRTQLNNSQSQLHNLHKKMSLIEEELTTLHKGVSPSRVKRSNQKLRAKAFHTANPVVNSPRHASQMRVKPSVLAKALTNKATLSSNRDLKDGCSPKTDVENAKSGTQDTREKNTVNKYGGWLYGILGDETPDSSTCLPTWSSHEHWSERVEEPRLNPWNILCPSNVGARGCQEKNCTFQHLPQDDNAASIQFK